MKSSSQSSSHRKPVGGVRSVSLCTSDNIAVAEFVDNATVCNQLEFVDDKAVMECMLLEDCSSFEEKFAFNDGVVAVRHTLTLIADRNLAEAWLEPEFRNDSIVKGLCAIITLNDGRKILVGYSERFGASQPLHISEIALSSGRKLSDAPKITMVLESFDTSAAAVCAIN
ncbi:MAG: hypothetical protein II307_01615 [Alistipes sp.]|nr:hypothetical protein [Alistipes sp.]